MKMYDFRYDETEVLIAHQDNGEDIFTYKMIMDWKLYFELMQSEMNG